MWTISVGGSFTVSGFGFTFTFEFGGAFDQDFNSTTYMTLGAGAAVGLPGVQFNPLQLSYTNAKSVQDLRGLGYQTGVSFNSPVIIGGSIEAIGGKGYQGISIGIGGGTPGLSFNNALTSTALSIEKECPQ